jgi:bacillolysin
MAGRWTGSVAGIAVAIGCTGCLDTPPSATSDTVDPDAASMVRVTSSPGVSIPDLATVVDAMEVDAICVVESLTIDVDIDTTFRGELVLALAAPGGDEARLTGFDGYDDRQNLIGNFPLDFEPLESLDRFADLDAQGTWTFTVDDDGPGDSGRLNRWGLNLTCR